VVKLEIIQTAFCKMGVWPFDPAVITEVMMAPSKDTSCEAALLVVLATPICAVAKMLHKLL
jgi:hypothetical protein